MELHANKLTPLPPLKGASLLLLTSYIIIYELLCYSRKVCRVCIKFTMCPSSPAEFSLEVLPFKDTGTVLCDGAKALGSHVHLKAPRQKLVAFPCLLPPTNPTLVFQGKLPLSIGYRFAIVGGPSSMGLPVTILVLIPTVCDLGSYPLLCMRAEQTSSCISGSPPSPSLHALGIGRLEVHGGQ